MRDRSHGLALIVVVGILGVLAVLAVAFLTMAQLERRASEQRLNGARAYLLARSGIEDALARLDAGQDPLYGGENWDGSADGLLTDFEAAQEVYRRTGAGTPADIDACPVRHALRPSFFVRFSAQNADPALLGVDGRKRGYSGVLSGDYVDRGNAYALKVEDESGKINVNGGFLDGQDRDLDAVPDHRDSQVLLGELPTFSSDVTVSTDIRLQIDGQNPVVISPKASQKVDHQASSDPGRGWNAQLCRVLNTLGDVLGLPRVIDPGSLQGALGMPLGLGDRILLHRPQGGYRAIQDLQIALGLAQDLSPYLTVSSWVDGSVVHPNGLEPPSSGYYSPSQAKKARVPLRLEEAGRPPVNLNAAARPVLLALLMGLAAQSSEYAVGGGGNSVGIDGPMAGRVADAMMAARPFDTWTAFAAFCDALDLNPAQADLLKANFDPNTRLNKHLEDPLLWRWIDKSDLVTWSTEGCLGPTGRFRVSCVGRVLGTGGRLLATRTLSTLCEGFSVLRQTTQQDFVGGRAYLPEYLSLSTDPLTPTTGASASAAWWGGPSPGVGLAAVTYPCPPTALPGRAADFDGCIGLATLELHAAQIPAPCLFLHHFDDGWDADLGNPSHRMPDRGSTSLQVDLTASVWPDPTGPLPPLTGQKTQSVQQSSLGEAWESTTSSIPLNEPNTLYPDGAHLQHLRGLSYRAAGNLPQSYGPDETPSNHAVLSYWAKAPLRSEVETGWFGACDFTCRAQATEPKLIIGPGSIWGWGLEGGTQFVGIGRKWGDWGIMAENRATSNDPGYERQYRVNHSPNPLKNDLLKPGTNWHLVTARFDTDETARGLDVHAAVWSALGRGKEDAVAGYPDAFRTAEGQDLLKPDVMFKLGGGGQLYVHSVVDEFAILDFGDDAPAAAQRVAAWHALRFSVGRYYKSDDAAFSSVVLEPQPGRPVRLLRAGWTAFLPCESRQEIATREKGFTGSGGSRPRSIDPLSANASVGVDLLDGAGATVLQPLAQGARIGRALDRFRYRVTFKNNLDDPLNQPVLETPFFDDITFTWQPVEGSRILRWEESRW